MPRIRCPTASDTRPSDIGDRVRAMTAAEPGRRTTDLADIMEVLKARDEGEPAESED